MADDQTARHAGRAIRRGVGPAIAALYRQKAALLSLAARRHHFDRASASAEFCERVGAACVVAYT
jgi:hypothetical protein